MESDSLSPSFGKFYFFLSLLQDISNYKELVKELVCQSEHFLVKIYLFSEYFFFENNQKMNNECERQAHSQ